MEPTAFGQETAVFSFNALASLEADHSRPAFSPNPIRPWNDFKSAADNALGSTEKIIETEPAPNQFAAVS